MIRVWRIARARRAAFDGEGARLRGGRWNRSGTAVVCASSSLALAALEVLVRVDTPEAPADLVAVFADIPTSVKIARLQAAQLPKDWDSYPPPSVLADLGTEWARAGNTAVLAVPSAVIRQELNYLLNPLHPAFRRIRIGKPAPFQFDPRLPEG